MHLIIRENINDLNRELADWITTYIANTLKYKADFFFCLSGGNTPQKLYQTLASPPYKDKIEWEKIHFFWGDERYVPLTDERNNAGMALREMLQLVPVKKENIHIIDTGTEADVSASNYDSLLRNYFEGKNYSFDLVLLGLGSNSHTLSLFPGYRTVHEKKKWVSSFYLDEQKMFRITLTAPVINKASAVIFIATGPDKADAVKHILEDGYDPDQYPAQVIKPGTGKLYWWVNEEAAKKISPVTIKQLSGQISRH